MQFCRPCADTVCSEAKFLKRAMQNMQPGNGKHKGIKGQRQEIFDHFLVKKNSTWSPKNKLNRLREIFSFREQCVSV